MTPERWVRVREIFAAALAEPPDRRSSFLAQACAGDPSLQEEAEALLASHGEAGSFIEHGPRFDGTAVDGEAPKPEEAPAPAAGRAIGAFRVLRQIGKGGMGVVYEAEQRRSPRAVSRSS